MTRLIWAIAMVACMDRALAQLPVPSVTDRAREETLKACAIIKDEYDALVESGDLDWAGLSDRSQEAIVLCGRLRAAEAIPTLVMVLGVDKYANHISPRPLDESGYPYPAVPALIRIGAPAVPALIAGLPAPPPDTWGQRIAWRRNAYTCLAAILGPEGGVRALEQAIVQARTEEERSSYQRSLDRFREIGNVGLVVSDGYQLFHGNVRETLEAAQSERKSVKE
jgi:hypothetical protein